MKKFKKQNVAKQISIFLFVFISFQSAIGQTKTSEKLIKELDEAETKMFDGISNHRADYFKNYVADDYITINADGVMMNKEQTVADSIRAKMFEGITYKQFDKKIRVYDNVGIITGRTQAFKGDAYLVEFLYTVIFLKHKGEWMFTGWQGTISKDSPVPPPPPSN